MGNTLLLLFTVVTQTLSLPPKLLDGLCWVESRHKVDAVHHDDGNTDSLGVCQIKLQTAMELGFKGTDKQLMDPRINIFYAGKYLKRQLKRYKGDSAKAISAYNAGSYRQHNSKYVSNVLMAWGAR